MGSERDSERNGEERPCPGCGALESNWQMGGFVAKNGDTYCCQSCAEGRVCLCNPEAIEESLVKRWSA